MDRLNYAIRSRRLDPSSLYYTSAGKVPEETLKTFINAMEDIDGLALQFSFYKIYESPERTKKFLGTS